MITLAALTTPLADLLAISSWWGGGLYLIRCPMAAKMGTPFGPCTWRALQYLMAFIWPLIFALCACGYARWCYQRRYVR